MFDGVRKELAREPFVISDVLCTVDASGKWSVDSRKSRHTTAAGAGVYAGDKWSEFSWTKGKWCEAKKSYAMSGEALRWAMNASNACIVIWLINSERIYKIVVTAVQMHLFQSWKEFYSERPREFRLNGLIIIHQIAIALTQSDVTRQKDGRWKE